MINSSFKRAGIFLVALSIGVLSPSTSQASDDSGGLPVAGDTSEFEAGRDFIKATVFGIGPMVDEVSDALGDPEYDTFVESRVDTQETNARLDAFLVAYDRRRPGLVERVGEASRSGNPYELDVATSEFLEHMQPVARKLSTRAEVAATKQRIVAPEAAHSLAVVPIAVALAAYMYAGVAHTAAAAIQVAAGFAYYVYNKVKFWGASDGQASEIQHEELMLDLAEGLASE